MIAQIDDRVVRALADIRPETAFEGREGAPRTLAERMAFTHTPGASLAVVDGYEVAWAGGVGRCEAGRDGPVMPGTLFQAASISKPVTALAVMRLVQEGMLDLDRDVNEYLASWRVPANDGWQPRLTLRQLLSHTAGVTVHGFPGYAADERVPGLLEVLSGEPRANTPRIEVNVLPGLTGRYSGGGSLIVQLAMMDRLGKPFVALMRELVLEPLGMADSTFEQPLPEALQARAATAHPYKGHPLPGRWHTYPELAAAGLWTTAADLARAGVEVMRAAAGRPAAVFRRETAEAMLRPQHSDSGQGYRPGIGFFLRGEGDGRYFYHSGWNEGFVAHAQFFPATGQGGAIMLNSNEGNDLLFEVMGALGREFGWPGTRSGNNTAVVVTDLERYAGEYETEAGLLLRLSVRDGTLWLAAGGQPPLPLSARSESEFFARLLNVRVSFHAADSALMSTLTLAQDGLEVRAARRAAGDGPARPGAGGG